MATPPRPNPWLERRVLHIAHRGGAGEAPENTLAAFANGVARGADGIELDVHATADGEVVVLHDPTLERTTDAWGPVDALTFEEVASLDAAHWFVPGCGTCHGDHPDADYVLRGVARGERPVPDWLAALGCGAEDLRVPTLRSVLTRFPDRYVNLEIKRTAPETEPYEREVAELLREFGRLDDVIVGSFSAEALARFRELAPEVSTSLPPELALDFWLAAHDRDAELPSVETHALQIPRTVAEQEVVTADLVAATRSAGLALHVWTVDEPDDMRRLIELGVDGIMTDRPSVLAEVLSERVTGG